jgi:ribosomal protein S27E
VKRASWTEVDCPDCGGRGVVFDRYIQGSLEAHQTPCETCSGTGVLEPPEADDNYDGPVDHSWDGMDADYECYPEASS